MRRALLWEREKLLDHVRHLSLLRKKRQASPEELEALAEAYFRLALHPATPPSEAVAYLKEGQRIDGTNPRYAYHLARLFYGQNKMEKASRWIRRAAQYNPTSHRIWAHISLLQKEINREYHGKTGYEPDGLRLRGENIAARIRKGQDDFSEDLLDFDPPKLKAAKTPEKQDAPESAKPESTRGLWKRVSGAGTCRWTGIYDLIVEDLLEKEPREKIRDEMLPLLDRIIEMCRERTGGNTAFSVLGIEWLVAGYPVSTIRRLLENFVDERQEASFLLLETGCELFEAKLTDVPQRLASALKEGKIPPLLAAVIHHRRLLRQPLEFRALGMYRLARGFVEKEGRSAEGGETREQTEKKAATFIKALLNAAEKLEAPEPAPMNDALLSKQKEEAIDVVGARNLLAELEASCRKLEQAREDVFSFLKTKLEPMSKKIGDSREYSQAVKDHTAVTEFIGLLDRAGDAGIERLHGLTGRIQELKAAELGNDFVDRIDTCRKGFNELKMPKGLAVVQNRIDRSLKSQAEGKTASEVDISADLGRLIQAAREASGLPTEAPPSGAVSGEEGGKPALGPIGKKWPDKLAGIEGVKEALDLVDREVDAVIEKRLAPFREYSEADMRHPSLQALRAMVKSEAAELLYRLSQPERALALWNELIAEDALNLDALKNIAVCESLNEKDHSAILGAWRAYGERLYLCDILLQDPRPHAERRADFHRDFASAYSAGLLKDEVEAREGKKDMTSLLSLANNPGYLEEFISHKVAEFLNRRMNLNTPTLVLGVERTAGPERRQKALDEMLSFVQEACGYLPPKAQEGFRKICSDLLRKAFEACAGTEGRTISKNIDFNRDEEKYVHWIADVYRLKKTFFVALHDPKDWIHKIKSVDFLPLLDRLNMLPTGTSADYRESAVSSLRLGEASAVVENLDFTVTKHTITVLQYLFDDQVDRKRREDLFWKLAAGLTRYRPFWEKLADRDDENLKNALKAIDEASTFYPEEVIRSLKGTDGSGAAAKFLEERCRRYPALTGPAQHLFMLYHKQRVPEKAIPFLEAAAKNGFWKEGREECRKRLNSLKLPGEIDGLLKSKNYRGALKVLRTQMKENPASQDVLDSLVKCYSDWIENKPTEAGSLIPDIDSDIETWLEGAREQLQARDVATLKRNKHALLTNAALAALGKLDSVEKIGQLEEAMSGLLKRDGENMPAVYYLMIANFQKALNLANSGLMAEARTEFRKADRLADRLLAEAQDDYRNKAREYKQEIEKARAQLGF